MANVAFHWDDCNETKIDAHGLSKKEVEHAWTHGSRTVEYEHPEHGAYMETTGTCPKGRSIVVVWRWNVRDGIDGVYVITAY